MATPIPAAIVGNWGLTRMTKNGAAITMVSGVQPTALFTADGAISGLASCNQYSGSYVLTGASAIAVGPLATTRETRRRYLAPLPVRIPADKGQSNARREAQPTGGGWEEDAWRGFFYCLF